MNPRVTDNDKDEISVTLAGKELRGWNYKDDAERRAKMLMAREYVEGYCDGRNAVSPESMVCRHETTHRSGAIWTVCDDCGIKWDANTS